MERANLKMDGDTNITSKNINTNEVIILKSNTNINTKVLTKLTAELKAYATYIAPQ